MFLKEAKVIKIGHTFYIHIPKPMIESGIIKPGRKYRIKVSRGIINLLSK